MRLAAENRASHIFKNRRDGGTSSAISWSLLISTVVGFQVVIISGRFGSTRPKLEATGRSSMMRGEFGQTPPTLDSLSKTRTSYGTWIVDGIVHDAESLDGCNVTLSGSYATSVSVDQEGGFQSEFEVTGESNWVVLFQAVDADGLKSDTISEEFSQ